MSYYTMLSVYGRCTRQFKIGHLHQEVMWHSFYENESYVILPSKNALWVIS